MYQKIILGVLAGMGPRSTTPFLENILDSCCKLYNAKDDIDFPPITIFSLPTPFYLNRDIDHSKMIECLKFGIDALTNSGASIIAIPCNIAHMYYDEMYDYSKIPLLNIVNETVYCLNNDENNVFVMATDHTINFRLYDAKVLNMRKKIFWETDIQKEVNRLIKNSKHYGITPDTINLWEQIEFYLYENGVSEVIIACTDISFYKQYSKCPIVYHDSSKILAESLVRYYLSTRVK